MSFYDSPILVEDYFPEHVREHCAKYKWANEPDYKHYAPSPIWNREKWLLYIKAHEDLNVRAQAWETDMRKLSELTVADLIKIIRYTTQANR